MSRARPHQCQLHTGLLELWGHRRVPTALWGQMNRGSGIQAGTSGVGQAFQAEGHGTYKGTGW